LGLHSNRHRHRHSHLHSNVIAQLRAGRPARLWQRLVMAAAVVVGLGCPGPQACATRTPHVPDWVQQAAATPLPKLRARDGAVVLLEQTEVTVDTQGRALVHERRVVRILSNGGRDYGIYRLFYDQGSKVHYVHCWTLGADQKSYQLDDRDVVDVTAAADFEVFDAERVRVAHAEAVEPGATVAFESEYQEAPYISSWTFDVDQEIPSAGQTVRLTLPTGFVYREGWAHMQPVKAEPAGGQGAAGPGQQVKQWQWQIGPRASLDDEDGAPELGEVAARMMLAYSGGPVAPNDGDWRTVGQWYARLNSHQGESTADIASEVAQLTAGKAAFQDKLLAITGFMQDQIRYVAVEMGIGGWQPHAAGQVFHNRYGDCKDKATLLVTMLGDAGITAYPLIVDFDHRVDPEMATHYADHMITVIEIPQGTDDPALEAVVQVGHKRMLVFDPTNPVSPAGSLEPELQGTYGLVLRGEESTLIRLPVLTPKDNTLVRTGKFTLGADGTLSGELTERRAGNTGDLLRRLYLEGDRHKLEEREMQTVARSLSNATVTDLIVEKAGQRSEPLQVSFRVAANGYAKHAGPMLLVRPAVMGLYEPEVGDGRKARLYPIDMGEESAVLEDYTIELPAGGGAYTPDDMPDPVKLETPFASFESSVTLQGNALHYKRALSIRAMEIAPEQYAAYREFIGQVGNAERSEAILRFAP
jgi:hypothetical protein